MFQCLDMKMVPLTSLINPFFTGTGWTLYKVYGGLRISYGSG